MAATRDVETEPTDSYVQKHTHTDKDTRGFPGEEVVGCYKEWLLIHKTGNRDWSRVNKHRLNRRLGFPSVLGRVGRRTRQPVHTTQLSRT